MLKFPDICLAIEGKPQKKSQETDLTENQVLATKSERLRINMVMTN